MPPRSLAFPTGALLTISLFACADGADRAVTTPISADAPGAGGSSAGAAGAPTTGTGGAVGSGAMSGGSGQGGAAGGAGTKQGGSGAPASAGASGAAAAGQSGAAGTSGFVTAMHQPFPKLEDHGGPKLAHVELFTITYPGYPYEAEVQAFADWVPTSDWLDAVGKEYGVGKGKHTGHLVMTEPAPAQISDDEIQVLLSGLVIDGALPAPTDQSLFMIFFPESTTVVLQGSPSCVGFGAYHASAGGKSAVYAYAVEPACPGMKFGPDEGSGIQITASHELIEATTDPFPSTKPGWVVTTGADVTAFPYIGAENADLCAHQPIQQDGFWVQRSWSALAAAAGQNPCVPVPPGEIYYNVSVPNDAVRAVAAGESTVFDVTGWSLEAVPDWQIDAQKKIAEFEPALELDRATLNNGGVAHLKVTVPPGTKSQSTAGFVVRSLRNGNTDDYTMWPMAIFVP